MTVAQLIAMLLGFTEVGVRVYGDLNEDKKREAVIVSNILGQMFDRLPDWVELAKKAGKQELTLEDLVGVSREDLRAQVDRLREGKQVGDGG